MHNNFKWNEHFWIEKLKKRDSNKSNNNCHSSKLFLKSISYVGLTQELVLWRIFLLSLFSFKFLKQAVLLSDH
jgi:hypothetical protein